jgi:CheY-like chemotaxis protein
MESKTKIYLAAPDSDLNRELRERLEGGGFQIQEALDWSLVAEEVGLFGADVVVLEESLSGVVSQIKSDPRTADRPVLLVLSERSETSIRRGLDAGADDVIGLPLLGADLVNRVRLLRRAGGDAFEMPDLVLSVADERAPIALDDVDEAPPSGLRVARNYGDGLPHGMDAAYEGDLGVLIEASEAMASSLPTVDALYVLTRRISEIIAVHRCNVLLVGVKPDEAFVVASHDDANLKRQQVDLRRYPEVRRCLESGEIVLIEDVRKDPEMEEVLDFITSVDLRSALVFPLFVREVVVGTLSLTSRREVHGFTRRELLFTRVMANMAAGLLSTSQLLEALRKDAASEKPPMEEFDEVVLDLEDQIEGLIEELERK